MPCHTFDGEFWREKERKREKNQSNRISSTLSLYYRTDKRCQMAFGSLKVRLYVTRLFWAKPADRPTDRPINRQHIFFLQSSSSSFVDDDDNVFFILCQQKKEPPIRFN